MNRATLIDRVKVKLDELTPFDEDLLVALPNADIKPVEAYIDEALDEATTEVLLRVPLHKLSPKRVATAMAVPTSDGVGYVDCPADFLRLYSFKMEGWHREVEFPISEGNPNYKLQRNHHTRGGVVKPVVVLNHRKTETKQLEYYSLPNGVAHKVEKFLYVPITVAENLADNLVVLLIWICARKVFEVLQMKNAEVAEKEVQLLLQLENY